MAFPDSLPDLPASRAKNRRPYGREYPVSKVEGNFVSIQKAIDAAVAGTRGITLRTSPCPRESISAPRMPMRDA
jgi:hypothetical protein